ncbi:LysR family transcriptional regulator [Mycoplasma sp. P36-A1]|uniref:LysR family transcriptional regulator n=1 Tax=Mycoplasma sp. P36-A1 TaxID=3252900 RepID=UPI003C2FF85B
MDIKHLEYIIKIADEGSITKAAAKLYITQSALNQQLLKLEKEIGVSLFNRMHNKLTTTQEGEVYISAAKQIIAIKNDTYNEIKDLANIHKQELSIGFTPARGIAMFSGVYPSFHKLFPDIKLTLHELGVYKQLELVQLGEIDIAFVNVKETDQKSSIEYVVFAEDEMLLAVPKDNSINSKAKSISANGVGTIDLSLFNDEEFILMNKNSTLRNLQDECFKKAKIKPNILFETENNATVITMIENNIGCGFLPAYYVDLTNDKVRYYSIEGKPSTFMCAAFKKNRYKTKAAKQFTTLAAKYWQKAIPKNL